MRINDLYLKIVVLLIAVIIRGNQSTLPSRFSNGGEAVILLKQHPDVFAQAYQDKIFLQTYGNLLGRPRLFSRQTPVRYQPQTNLELNSKVSEFNGGRSDFNPGSSPSGKKQKTNVVDEKKSETETLTIVSENASKPEDEYIYVKLTDEDERLKLVGEDELSKDNIENDLSKTESSQSEIKTNSEKNAPLIIKSPEEDEIMKGNANNVNEEKIVRDDGNGEFERKEITRRDERVNESQTEEKEREEELDPIETATVDEKVIGVIKGHQEQQDTKDDGDSYAPFEVVVQLRERKTVRPLVSKERTESGKDKYRSRGYKQTNYRKIERLEETEYFEEEWDKERKVELKENGKVVWDEEEDKIKEDIANHYAKHPGAGHSEIPTKAKMQKERPEYWDTYKYHAPQLSKDFKINDHFRQWVLQMSK